MPWYDIDYDNGNSDTHRYADKQWWQNAFSTGTVLDRDEMKAIIDSMK